MNEMDSNDKPNIDPGDNDRSGLSGRSLGRRMRRPPSRFPNYGAYRQVIVLVVLLVIVGFAMYEAGKPENWAWMGFEQQRQPVKSDEGPSLDNARRDNARRDNARRDNAPSNATELDDDAVNQDAANDNGLNDDAATNNAPNINAPGDNALSDNAKAAASENEQGRNDQEANNQEADQGTVRETNERATPPEPTNEEEELEWSAIDLGSATRRAFWEQAFRRLDRLNRLTLVESVLAVNRGEQITAEQLKSLQAAFDELEKLRKAFHGRMLEAMVSESDSRASVDESSWSERLFEMQQVWEHEVVPSFENALAQQPYEPREREFFAWLGETLKEISIEAIEDGTADIRDIELPAWSMLTQELLEQTPAELAKASVGRVQLHQLLGQTSFYRGKVVTIRGRLIRGRKVDLTQPIAGQESIYELWIAPLQRAVFPFCVYALSLPAELPDVGRASLKLNRKVTVNGILFKRRFYMAQDDSVATCPLILARSPQVTSERTEELTSQARFPLDAQTLWIVLILAAVIAVSVAVAVYRASSRRIGLRYPFGQRANNTMNELENDPNVETVEQRLERLKE